MTLHESALRYLSPFGTFEMSGNIAFLPVSKATYRDAFLSLYRTHELPLKTLTAEDRREEDGHFRILAIFGVTGETQFLALNLPLSDDESFPSLAKDVHETNLYERKIMTFFGLVPVGHPNPQRIILHPNWPEGVYPLRKDYAWDARPESADPGHNFTAYTMSKIGGEGIYEIPVGPIHAGIIEPGHFRFSVAGEEIIRLEALLGWVHKGSEKLFETLPLPKTLTLAEHVAGDSSIGHPLAFAQAVETLQGILVPERAKLLRVLFAELERIANHLNSLAGMQTDTAFTFGSSQGGRLREQIMQWNERLTGNRFLRGTIAFGGVRHDVASGSARALEVFLNEFFADFEETVNASWESSSFYNRLEGTGVVSLAAAHDLGGLGVPARAAGRAIDTRMLHPYAAYSELPFEISVELTGDVLGRFRVRIREVRSSIALIQEVLKKLEHVSGPISSPLNERLKTNATAGSAVEGWRGDIFYYVATDAEGKLARVEVRDPSFLNWPVAAFCAPGNIVPDFPLINKSFDLSYTGNDL